MDLHPDRAAEALALVDPAVQRASDQHQVWEEAHALLARAYVLWKSGRREEARATADTALRKMEELRAKQEDIEVQIRYEDTLAFAYELVAGLTLDPRFGDISAKDVESALSITERMRARALLEDVLGPTEPSGSHNETKHSCGGRFSRRRSCSWTQTHPCPCAWPP